MKYGEKTDTIRIFYERGGQEDMEQDNFSRWRNKKVMVSGKKRTALGRMEIFLPRGGQPGRCYYSDETEHGLGPGPVRLSFAFGDAFAYQNGPLESEQLLFGSLNVFEESEYIPGMPPVDIGAILFQDRGTFKVGIRLASSIPQKQIVIYWWAETLEELEPEEKDTPTEAATEEFFIENAPKFLRKGMKYQFQCALPKGYDGPVHWKVLGQGGGSIDHNGMYTAPNVQGVFQIEASLDDQEKKTTVYIMIKE